jgi:hypothetical protein
VILEVLDCVVQVCDSALKDDVKLLKTKCTWFEKTEKTVEIRNGERNAKVKNVDASLY